MYKKAGLLSNDCLFKQRWNGLYDFLHKSGCLDVLSMKKGGDMQEGQSFGEIELTFDQKRCCTIVARMPTRIVEISKKCLKIFY